MNINKALHVAIKHHQEGNLQQAKHICIEILKVQPDNADVLYYLGVIYFQLNDYELTIKFLKQAISINFNNLDAYNLLGVVYQKKRQLDEAIACFQKVLEINPNSINAYYNLGIAFQDKGLTDKAIFYYQKVIHLDPTDAEAHYNLGTAFVEKGLFDKAINSFDMAVLNKPDYFAALWSRCMSQLPVIYPDKSSILTSRQRYHDELMWLNENLILTTQQDIETATEVIGSQQPFYLAYQGMNDLELQRIYGDLVHRIMASRYPHFTFSPETPLLSSNKTLRIGIVSGHFYHHTVWKLFKGWVEHLDKDRFNLYGYYTGKIKDHLTEVARQQFNRFVEDVYSFEDLCKIIRNDNLHVLIYPEIGMDPITIRLAALKLAPIQCNSWGHPDTSGLPTLDYFLSSELMEPPDADEHYTEKLIRLPNLSIYYIPLDISRVEISRETFGLRPKSILFLCCQSLFKYLPQYDMIYPQIAKMIGDCQFLFISSRKSSFITEQFRLRISHEFRRFNLKADDYIVMLPRLSFEKYNAINLISDVFLDSIGWSGGNTTFEAIACNLPVITFPGSLMRGRHSYAILTMMGLTETIAESLDDYIDLAVKLGKDLEWRKQILEKIATNKSLIYRDKKCITALEDFLEKAVKENL